MGTADPRTIAQTTDRSLTVLRATFRMRFEAATTEQALRDENAKILGKKGELTAILKQLGPSRPTSARPSANSSTR
jgi:hypothetical protein